MIHRGIPYLRIYEPPKSFKSPDNWLIPRCPITVKITEAEHSSSNMLHPYLYTIEVQHSNFSWTVKRRQYHFNQLHKQLLLYRATLLMPLPTKKHKERRKSVGPSARRPVPRFPRKPEVLVSEDELPKRKVSYRSLIC